MPLVHQCDCEGCHQIIDPTVIMYKGGWGQIYCSPYCMEKQERFYISIVSKPMQNLKEE